MLRLLSIVAGVVLFVFASASAEAEKPLTEDAAKRFLASLESTDRLGEELRESGKMDRLQIDTTPKAGEEFKPYSRSVAKLKELYPGDYKKLSAAVKPHGFSAKSWGETGDRVVTAHLAVKLQEENPDEMAQFKNMDKSMLDMMPPEMRDRINGTIAMMEAIDNTPEADKKAIAPIKDDLDAYMEKDAEKRGKS